MSGFINHTSFSSFFIAAIKVYNIQRKAMSFRAIPHNCPLLAFPQNIDCHIQSISTSTPNSEKHCANLCICCASGVINRCILFPNFALFCMPRS